MMRRTIVLLQLIIALCLDKVYIIDMFVFIIRVCTIEDC